MYIRSWIAFLVSQFLGQSQNQFFQFSSGSPTPNPIPCFSPLFPKGQTSDEAQCLRGKSSKWSQNLEKGQWKMKWREWNLQKYFLGGSLKKSAYRSSINDVTASRGGVEDFLKTVLNLWTTLRVHSNDTWHSRGARGGEGGTTNCHANFFAVL